MKIKVNPPINPTNRGAHMYMVIWTINGQERRWIVLSYTRALQLADAIPTFRRILYLYKA